MDFCCQKCRTRLDVSGIQHVSDGGHASYLQGVSAYGNSKLEGSFIVLDKDKRSGQRGMEESFVVLAGAASLLKQSTGPSHDTAHHYVDACISSLAKTFEIASGETRVDHPLCLECATRVKEEIENMVEEVEEECRAYDEAIARLEQENLEIMPQEEFELEMEKARAEEAAARQRAAVAAKQLEEEERELASLRAAAAELAEAETQYWHDLNDFQMQFQAHADDRTAILRRIDRSKVQLEKLRKSNAYDDVFKILPGPTFYTISGLRLGRLNSHLVEWTEVNAAWGQAVLLLDTLAKACRVRFQGVVLHPMGSYPRVSDKQGMYDLFGPVKLYCKSYDKAMKMYLGCLQAFHKFMVETALAEGDSSPDLPHAIDGEYIGGISIRLSFTNLANWTKALTFMLADLKWVLAWFIGWQAKRVRSVVELANHHTALPSGPRPGGPSASYPPRRAA